LIDRERIVIGLGPQKAPIDTEKVEVDDDYKGNLSIFIK
jgi:hypothetical protein